jgi:nitrite reductase/ring-hydroxylating ferredoxin subunit
MASPLGLAFPSGWFALALSRELGRGQVVSRRFNGRDVALWRTQSGAAVVSDAYCPHLGAHLGACGAVVGEDLRCPFHGFRFDRRGACVATGYDTKPPAKAALFTYPTRERDGVVFAYHHAAGAPPSWELPALDPGAFGPFAFQVHRFRGHPQETSENSVDFGHLRVLHGYENVEMLEPAAVDGPLLTARYAFTRKADFLGRPDLRLRTDASISVWGLGFSVVEGSVHALRIRYRLFVMAVATDTDQMECRLGVSLDTSEAQRAFLGLRVLPGAVHRYALPRLFLLALAHDFGQDVPLWSTKRHVERPVLAAGDGPIGLYRRWVRQFYEGAPAEAERAGSPMA